MGKESRARAQKDEMKRAWVDVLQFGLGPLQDFDPELLLTGDDEVDGFVLALAVGYNDLKGIQWMNWMLSSHHPSDKQELSADAGQWNGMRSGKLRAGQWRSLTKS